MKIVFFGTAEFGINSLESLIKSGHRIQAVVTQPDRKRGRGQKLQPSPIKLLAGQYRLPLYQPSRPADITSDLKRLEANLFVVVSYGCILPKQILEIPELGCINLHPSLLPKYRGAAPINWALISGEKRTGLTIIRMDEKMDSGEIILQETVEINPDDDAVSLSEKLSLGGGKLLLEAVQLIEEGKAKFLPQDKAEATYAPKLKKEDGLIDWGKSASVVHNQVRGTIPWPGTYTHIKGKTLKIWKTQVCLEDNEPSAQENFVTTLPLENPPLFPPLSKGGLGGLGKRKQRKEGPCPKGRKHFPILQAKPGQIIGVDNEKGVLVKTGKAILCLKELQLEGKKRMGFTQFLLGHPLSPNQMLGEKTNGRAVLDKNM